MRNSSAIMMPCLLCRVYPGMPCRRTRPGRFHRVRAVCAAMFDDLNTSTPGP